MINWGANLLIESCLMGVERPATPELDTQLEAFGASLTSSWIASLRSMYMGGAGVRRRTGGVIPV